jgi:hypothetical protein
VCYFDEESIEKFLLFSFVLAIKTIIKLCPRCQENGINNSMRNKRKCEYDTVVDSILPDIEKLSIGQVS